MKLLLIAFGLVSTSAFAQITADINLGRGEYICMAEGIKSYPVVARGRTMNEAEHYAKAACADYEGSDFHCDVEECDRDTNRNNINIDIDFTIERNGSNVSINLTNGEAGYVCTAEAWRKSYIASAPTELEAETLAKQTCIADGNHGMHCDIEECESLSRSRRGSRRGGINIGGGIRVGRGGIRIGN